MLTLDDFDFDLPPELIAQHPAAERTASRLLHVAGNAARPRNSPTCRARCNPGDLLVFNDTKVIKARLFGQKESGGQVEVMIERIVDAPHAVAQIRASKSPKPGSRIVSKRLHAHGDRPHRRSEFFALELKADGDLYALIEQHGRCRCRPTSAHAAGEDDERATRRSLPANPGAVAAPTAGLHFDEAMLAHLPKARRELAWLTLHVGAGTFQPVRVHNSPSTACTRERFEIPQATVDAIAATRARGGRVIAVGTTSLRALESAAQAGELHRRRRPKPTSSSRPGYQFQVVDRLITNFHLPKSTLLMLVSAFAGMRHASAPPTPRRRRSATASSATATPCSSKDTKTDTDAI
jgi:S-adenosylmethionine:tRNA ribosyltransferase-isomerase